MVKLHCTDNFFAPLDDDKKKLNTWRDLITIASVFPNISFCYKGVISQSVNPWSPAGGGGGGHKAPSAFL